MRIFKKWNVKANKVKIQNEKADPLVCLTKSQRQREVLLLLPLQFGSHVAAVGVAM